MSKEFIWTDELVEQVCDWCHQDGWHKFSKKDGVEKLIAEFKASHQPKEDKPEQITIDDACNVYNTFVLEKRQSFRSALKEFYSQKSKPKEELKEPDRMVTVKRLQYQGLLAEEGYWNYNLWISCGEIPSEKYEPIKQAIEQVLNDYSGVVSVDISALDNITIGKDGRKLTPKELIHIMHKEGFIQFPPKRYSEEQVNKMMEDAATGFTHYLEFIMDEDDWLKDDGDGMKSMQEVYNDFTQWKNSKKSSLK